MSYLISEELLSQIQSLIKDSIQASRRTEDDQPEQNKRFTSRFPTHAVILDTGLAAASSFLSSPTGSIDPNEPNATICEVDSATGEYTQTDRRLAVANHSTESHALNTPGAAISINGHYWFFGDCNIVTSRPTPPWESE